MYATAHQNNFPLFFAFRIFPLQITDKKAGTKHLPLGSVSTANFYEMFGLNLAIFFGATVKYFIFKNKVINLVIYNL